MVFWLAHVYADFLGHGLRHARSNLRLLASIMAQELSMLVAPALSILFLLLGALGVLEEWTSTREVDTGAMRPWSMVAGGG